MTTTNSITRLNAVLTAIAVLSENGEYADVVATLEKMAASLQKEKSAVRSHSDSARTIENKAVKETIIAELTRLDRAVTVAELMAESPVLAAYTAPRITSLLALLKKDGRVMTEIIKRHTYYSTPMAE